MTFNAMLEHLLVFSPIIWSLTLGAGVCLLVGYCCYQHLRLIRLQKQFERLWHELQVVNDSAMGVGKQLLVLEGRVYKLAEQQTQVPDTSTAGIVPPLGTQELPVADSQVYQRSRAWLDDGCHAQEVAKKSGLPYSEVSLMKKLCRPPV